MKRYIVLHKQKCHSVSCNKKQVKKHYTIINIKFFLHTCHGKSCISFDVHGCG